MRQEPNADRLPCPIGVAQRGRRNPQPHGGPAGQAASAAAAIDGLSTRRVTPRRLGAENPSAGREGIRLPACIVLT